MNQKKWNRLERLEHQQKEQGVGMVFDVGGVWEAEFLGQKWRFPTLNEATTYLQRRTKCVIIMDIFSS